MPRRTTSGQPGIIRRLLGLAVASLTLGTVLVATGAASASAGGEEYDFLSKINSSRSAHGLRPLSMASDLQSVARSWSQHMASGGCAGDASICHNPNLTSQVNNWRKVGENVGVGPNVSAIETAFMNSAPHRANILDPDYTQVGIGTAYGKDGRLYVTQDFRQPMNTSTSSGTTKKKPSSAGTTTNTSAPAPSTTSTPSTSSPVASPSRTAAQPVAQKTHLADRLRAVASTSHPGQDPVGQALSFVSTMGLLAR